MSSKSAMGFLPSCIWNGASKSLWLTIETKAEGLTSTILFKMLSVNKQPQRNVARQRLDQIKTRKTFSLVKRFARRTCQLTKRFPSHTTSRVRTFRLR